jgi:hypothetical protein
MKDVANSLSYAIGGFAVVRWRCFKSCTFQRHRPKSDLPREPSRGIIKRFSFGKKNEMLNLLGLALGNNLPNAALPLEVLGALNFQSTVGHQHQFQDAAPRMSCINTKPQSLATSTAA